MRPHPRKRPPVMSPAPKQCRLQPRPRWRGRRTGPAQDRRWTPSPRRIQPRPRWRGRRAGPAQDRRWTPSPRRLQPRPRWRGRRTGPAQDRRWTPSPAGSNLESSTSIEGTEDRLRVDSGPPSDMHVELDSSFGSIHLMSISNTGLSILEEIDADNLTFPVEGTCHRISDVRCCWASSATLPMLLCWAKA